MVSLKSIKLEQKELYKIYIALKSGSNKLLLVSMEVIFVLNKSLDVEVSSPNLCQWLKAV